MYMPKEKARVVMRAFVISQFSYCPLLWMFHGKGANSKINHIHERALRIAYQHFTSSFAELLINDNSVSIFQRNLQLLVIEIYRTKININPSFMKEIFIEREIHYNLRVTNSVYARKPSTNAYGIETKFPRAKSLDLPLHIKKSQSVKRFKRHTKGWNFICNYRLCRSFVVNLGYI